MAWVRTCFVNYKKGCTRLATASDKVYQLLAHGRWFSPGTPASSTTESGIKHQKSKLALLFLSAKSLCLMSNQPIIFSISQVVDADNITR